MIGRIAEKSDGRIRVERCRQMRPPVLAGRKGETMTKEKKVAACCAHEGPGAGGGSAMEKFEDFLGTAMQPGSVDVVTKELIAIALGLAVHCVPCTTIHIKKARSMGIGKEEIEEAAALAIAFGGCRAMMLWDELKESLLAGD
jgi:AhpD family alkylhydroperoxidase